MKKLLILIIILCFTNKLIAEDQLNSKDFEETLDFSKISPSELKNLQNLAKRQSELDARARELDNKAATLKALENTINQKIQEFEEAKKLLIDNSGFPKMKNIAKIYENMKSDNSAAVFNLIPTELLAGFVGMIENDKLSSIISAMNPEKAQELTIFMIKQTESINKNLNE